MLENEKEEQKEEEEEHAEEEHHEPEQTHVDEEFQDLFDIIDARDAEIEQLRTELAELKGRYDEHHTRHHAEQERRELPEPEPTPEERHIWFKPIGKR